LERLGIDADEFAAPVSITDDRRHVESASPSTPFNAGARYVL
jgi:hypothetical protein